MTGALVLFTNPQSRGRIAIWMREEIGQPFRSTVLDWGAPVRTPPRTRKFLALNPMGKCPFWSMVTWWSP